MERPCLWFPRGLFVAALVIITGLAVMPVHPGLDHVSDKLEHAAAFYVLALLLDFSTPRTAYRLRKALPLMAYGIALEVVQYFLPYREFSLLDMAADAAGLSLYGLSVPWLRRAPLLRRRWWGTADTVT